MVMLHKIVPISDISNNRKGARLPLTTTGAN